MPWRTKLESTEDMKRRNFIRLAAGVCATPFFNIGNAAYAGSVAQGRKIRLGLIGCGWRMGLCMDIAFAFADGLDPVADIKKYSSRLFDLHFRNISNPKDGLSGTDSTTGVIDYFRIIKTLAETGYSGVCGIELIHPFPKHPEWINLSVGYFRGLMDAVAHETQKQ